MHVWEIRCQYAVSWWYWNLQYRYTTENRLHGIPYLYVNHLVKSSLNILTIFRIPCRMFPYLTYQRTRWEYIKNIKFKSEGKTIHSRAIILFNIWHSTMRWCHPIWNYWCILFRLARFRYWKYMVMKPGDDEFQMSRYKCDWY